MNEMLGCQLALASKVVRDRADSVLAAHGVGVTTWIVLVHADGVELPGTNQVALAQDLEIDGLDLDHHIDLLEHDGLLQRTRDGKDDRLTRVTLTAEGRDLLERLDAVMAEEDQRMRAELTASETVALEQILAKLHDHARERVNQNRDVA